MHEGMPHLFRPPAIIAKGARNVKGLADSELCVDSNFTSTFPADPRSSLLYLTPIICLIIETVSILGEDGFLLY